MSIWNFAFGSHLSRSQLGHIVKEEPKVAMRAVLPDYRLTFWKLLQTPKMFAHLATGGSPALVQQKNSQVYGVVYRIAEQQFEVLDAYEKEWGYELIEVHVKTEDGKIVSALAHNRTAPSKFLAPSEEFLKLMLTGLQEHGYSAQIIEAVRKTAIEPISINSI
jgi:gamma-glutamylcyclotransferase (GGCT)/AIG2-like uncharacterized protein YtfP